MYGRTTKIFFGFMAFVMVVGYPVLLLTALPSFQSMFLGQQTAQGATQSQVEDNREKVLELDCGSKTNPPKGKRLKDCKRALQDLGSAYQTLASGTDEQQLTGEFPPNAERDLDKSLEAFKLLVAIDPDDAESQEYLATSYSAQGLSARALPIFTKLVKEDPGNVQFVFAKANAAQGAGKTELALATYRRVIKLAPEDELAEIAREAIDQIENPEPSPGLEGLDLSTVGG